MTDRNLHNYSAGLQNVGSYQVSSIPFASASITVPVDTPIEITFPRVTRFVNVKNVGTASADIRVGFSSRGVSSSAASPPNNYFLLSDTESYEGAFKVSSVFLMADGTTPSEANIIAGLTNIDTNNLDTNWSGSIGVG
jgi:hypothetical protein|tara:strand:+ start:911 stop:1324 length:414 start_codon:yes stop_codon:yes gene_type:complete